MRKIALLILVILTMVLAACTSDGEAKDKEQTGDKTEQAQTTEDDKQEEKPGQYSVHIDNATFKFKDSMQAIPFNVAKNGKPLTGEDLGVQVQVPIGNIPFKVKELENGNFEGQVQVPEPGVYQASVFKMVDNEMNVIGQFQLTFE
ncbi:hypothetical protein ACFO3D_08135 [Virgibacillus kekensis]|uniref:YtkA-like domain-containing protein n=1 Tax=Virgibacillus kekensis TaxID=202261 RepID=A0ABV9DH64_9BACI